MIGLWGSKQLCCYSRQIELATATASFGLPATVSRTLMAAPWLFGGEFVEAASAILPLNLVKTPRKRHPGIPHREARILQSTSIGVRSTGSGGQGHRAGRHPAKWWEEAVDVSTS